MLLSFLIQDALFALFTLYIVSPIARKFVCRRPVHNVRHAHPQSRYFIRTAGSHDLRALSVVLSGGLFLMLLVDQDGTRALYTWPVRYLLSLTLHNTMHVTLSYYVAMNIQVCIETSNLTTTAPSHAFLLRFYPAYLLLQYVIFTADTLFNLLETNDHMSIVLPSLRFIGYSSVVFIFVLVGTTSYILSEFGGSSTSGTRATSPTRATRLTHVLSTFQLNQANRFMLKNTLASTFLLLLFTAHLMCYDWANTCVPLSINVMSVPPLEVPTTYGTPSGLVYVLYLCIAHALSSSDDQKDATRPKRATSPRDSPTTSKNAQQRHSDAQRHDEQKKQDDGGASLKLSETRVIPTIVEDDSELDDEVAVAVGKKHPPHLTTEHAHRSHTPSADNEYSEHGGHESKSFTMTPSATSHHTQRSVSFAVGVALDGIDRRVSTNSIGEVDELRVSHDSVTLAAAITAVVADDVMPRLYVRVRPPSPVLRQGGSISSILAITIHDRASVSTTTARIANDTNGMPELSEGV